MDETRFIVGIDPGQVNDPTALVVLEHKRARHPTYHVRALHRFPLGTGYTELVRDVAARADMAPLKGRTRIAIDATGVGAPVVELFKQALPDAPLYAITITGGTNLAGTAKAPHVPKRDLINSTCVVLEQRRLKIAATLRDSPALIDELHAYRRTTSENGYDAYNAPPGSHDDLVIALSLALWLGDHRPDIPPHPMRTSIPQGRLPTADEMIRNTLRRHGSLYY